MLCINNCSTMFKDFSQSYSSLCSSNLFFQLPSLLQPFFEKSIQQFSKISFPIKIMLLDGLTNLISLNETILTQEICTFCYSLIEKVCQDNEATVQFNAVILLGYILFSETIFPLKKNKSEKMSVITAAAIIVNSRVFDFIPEQLKEALDVVEAQFDGKMKRLLKLVLESFWRNNNGSMLPSLEEELAQYSNLLVPSYFC